MHTHVCMHTYTYMHEHICVCVHTHTHIYVYTCMHSQTHRRTSHPHMLTHTSTSTHIHKHITHTQMQTHAAHSAYCLGKKSSCLFCTWLFFPSPGFLERARSVRSWGMGKELGSGRPCGEKLICFCSRQMGWGQITQRVLKLLSKFNNICKLIWAPQKQ